MKHRVLLSILLILIMSLTACSQQAPVSDTVSTETPSEEQTENVPETPETPAPAEEEEQASNTVKQELETQTPVEEPTSEIEEAPSEQPQESSAPAMNEGDSAEEEAANTSEKSDGTVNHVKELEDMVTRYETMLNDNTMPYNLKFIINSNTQDKIPAYEELLKDESISEADRVLINQYLAELEDMFLVYADMMYRLSEGDETEAQPEEEPEKIYTPPAPPAKLTDEEVQAFVNDYLDNFKANTDMSDWSDDAIAKLDENIEIVRNETPTFISRSIEDYQNGHITKDMVEWEIWSFLERGGYGDQEITVQ